MTKRIGQLYLEDNDGHHLWGRCKNCGSDVYCFPDNFIFPILDDYIWICSGEKQWDCINNRRPEFGSQDEPEWTDDFYIKEEMIKHVN